jgi:acyl carrier protein
MTVEALSAVFGRILGLPEVAPDANFFDLGGDSLLATRVLSAIARTCGVELTFDEFLDAPSPAGLVELVAGAAVAP